MKKGLFILFLIVGFTSYSLAQGIGFNGIAPKVSVLLPTEDGMEAGFGGPFDATKTLRGSW